MSSDDEGRLDDYSPVVEALRALGRPVLGTGVIDRYLEAARTDGSTGTRPAVERRRVASGVMRDDGLYLLSQPVWW